MSRPVLFNGRVRASGTFSYISGMSAMSLATCWAGCFFLLAPPRKKIGYVFVLAGLTCAASALSRSGMFFSLALILSVLAFSKRGLSAAIVLGAALTLLGLIIAFTFSMAINRYDQRKNYEEQEANAIGTEYVRAIQLAPADAAKVQALLRSYLDQRILNYKARNERGLLQINVRTAQLQTEMWSAASTSVAALPNRRATSWSTTQNA